MNLSAGDTPLVLLCPAWKKDGTAKTIRANSTILHSWADDVVPFADSEELVRNSGLPNHPGRSDQTLLVRRCNLLSIELRLARGESLHFATAEFMAASSLQLALWVGGDALTPEDVRVLASLSGAPIWVRVSDPANLPKFAGIPLSGILIETLRAGDTPFLDGLACDSLLIEDYGNEWRLTEELAARRLSQGAKIYRGNRWSRELFGNFEVRDSRMFAANVRRSICGPRGFSVVRE